MHAFLVLGQLANFGQDLDLRLYRYCCLVQVSGPSGQNDRGLLPDEWMSMHSMCYMLFRLNYFSSPYYFLYE